MKRFFRGSMAVLLLVATFIPFVNVNAAESSRVQIIMSESANNNYGIYDVSGGSFEITMNLNGPRAEFVDVGTQIILSVTPDQYHTFKGWYLAEEYEIVAGLMGWRPINENSPLSTNVTYQFAVTESYYNIMPVFESKVGHNNIWMTGNGEIAVLYENRDANEQQELDGEHWMSNGIVVDYIKGDEITLYARPTTGNYFVGWFITDRAASDPANYVREPVISTNTTFTYKPGITTIDVGGVEEPLNYITAVFAPNSSKSKRTVVTEFIASPYDTEEVPYDTDLATYTSSKKWNVTTEGTDTNNSWLELFGEVDGVWQYPAERGVTYTFVEQEITDTEILNKYTITYDQVIVTKAATPAREGLQFQVWSTTGGKVSTQFTLDEETEFMKSRDGSNYVDFDVAGIWKGTEVTVRAKANSGYKFVGWKHVDIDYEFDNTSSEHPSPCQGEVISTNTSYTYKPGVTILDGDTEELRYICAAFEVDEEPEQIVSYIIERGDGQTFKLTDSSNIEIKANGELSKLTGIKVDGTIIDSSNYALAEGSTILTLKNDYLKTLNPGAHTITFVYNDGSADATLTIANGSNAVPTNNTNNPLTGDNIMFYISMLGLSILGLVGTIALKMIMKRHKRPRTALNSNLTTGRSR